MDPKLLLPGTSLSPLSTCILSSYFVGRKLSTSELFLVDSGAQYRDGTTDITRTSVSFGHNHFHISFNIFFRYHVGNPTADEIEAFTRVLKGHIDLARVKFPTGTKGYQMDILARQSLWSVGLNYLHGTGHGVGSFLNVHEGPCGISWIANANACALKPGMILSDGK